MMGRRDRKPRGPLRGRGATPRVALSRLLAGTLAGTLAVALAAVMGLAPVSLAAATSGSAGVVQVQVTPAMAGVHLRVGGVSTITDAAGHVQVALTDINNVARSVTLASTRVDPRTTVRLTRVSPQPHTTPHVSNLQVGLEVDSAVRLSVDPSVTGVTASDVHSLRLHSLAGQVITVHPDLNPDVVLMSRRTMLQHGVLQTQAVTWTVDRVVTTDGAVVTTDRRRFDPGPHPRWTVRLVPVAGTVSVQTLPAVPGLQVTIGHQSVTTGAHGRVTAQVADLNAVSGRVRLLTSWAPHARVRLLHVAHLAPGESYHRRLLLALRVSRPVRLEFLDLQGGVVPQSRVGTVRLDQAGRILTVKRSALPQPLWLPTLAARNVHGHWMLRHLGYSVRAVVVDGANAVFSGKQHFVAGHASPWRIRLSVFPLSVTVSDALFGQQTSSGLQLRLPDGRHLAYRVGAGAPTVIPALARGLYHVQVDAAVIGQGTSVLVSQAGVADLRVVTALDVGVVLGFLLLVGAGLVYGGRVAARRSVGRPVRGTT